MCCYPLNSFTFPNATKINTLFILPIFEENALLALITLNNSSVQSTCVSFGLSINPAILWRPRGFIRQHFWTNSTMMNKEHSRQVKEKVKGQRNSTPGFKDHSCRVLFNLPSGSKKGQHHFKPSKIWLSHLSWQCGHGEHKSKKQRFLVTLGDCRDPQLQCDNLLTRQLLLMQSTDLEERHC